MAVGSGVGVGGTGVAVGVGVGGTGVAVGGIGVAVGTGVGVGVGVACAQATTSKTRIVDRITSPDRLATQESVISTPLQFPVLFLKVLFDSDLVPPSSLLQTPL